MDLIRTYEEYNKINNEYIEFINELVNTDVEMGNDDKILELLVKAQKDYEELMIEAEKIVVEEKDEINLKDLKYLLMDGIFISSDLVAFYKHKQAERFKMRAVNYINKKRKADMFKDSYKGECRV